MTPPTTPTPRGVCRGCDRRERLDSDGRITAHGDPVECSGTGYLPKPADR